MKSLRIIVLVGIVLLGQKVLAQTKIDVETFSKVIISPHIEATFVQGEEESVTILESTVSENKVNVKSSGGVLRVYLDDAKTTTKHKKIAKNGRSMKVPIYNGKVLTVKVVYKSIDNLSLRGEQSIVCESPINTERFSLKIYGESEVSFNEVNFLEFDVDVYGESKLTVQKGHIKNQNITVFGEGEINLIGVDNTFSKLKAFGEAEFMVMASERIKFTAFGEAELYYKGNPQIDRGLSIGESKVNQLN